MSTETLSIHNNIPQTRRPSKRFSFMSFSAPLDSKINSTIDSEISILKTDITSDKKRQSIIRKSTSLSILSFKIYKSSQPTIDLTHTPKYDHTNKPRPESTTPSTTPSLSSASSESLPSSKSSSEINSSITIPARTIKPTKQPSKFRQILAKFFKPKQQGPFNATQLQRKKTYSSVSVSRSKADFAQLYMDDDGTLDSADIDFNLATVEDIESAFNGYSYAAAPMRGTYHSSLKKLSDSPNRNLRQIILIQSILKRLKNHPLNGTAFNFASLPEDNIPTSRDPDGPTIPRQVRVMMVPQRRTSFGSNATGFGLRSRASITRTYSTTSTTRKAGPGITLQSKDSMKSWESIESPIY